MTTKDKISKDYSVKESKKQHSFLDISLFYVYTIIYFATNRFYIYKSFSLE